MLRLPQLSGLRARFPVYRLFLFPLALLPAVLSASVTVIPTGQTGAGAGEIKSTTSWKINGSDKEYLTCRHVFEIVLPGFTHTVVSGTPPHENTIDVYLFVPSSLHVGGSLSESAITVSSQPVTSGTSATVMVCGPTGDGKIPVHVPTTGTFVLPGGSGYYVVKCTKTVTWTNTPGGWVSSTTYAYERLDFALDKLVCSSMGASIDTRKAYGNPNVAGEYPANSNAPPRNVNFKDWIFRGGLFAGVMPLLGSDRSGIARIQFRTTTTETSGSYLFSVLSLYYMGSPTDFNSDYTGFDADIDLGVYVPDDEDENLSLGEQLLR